MKTFVHKIRLIMFFLLLGINFCLAATPEYKINISDVVRVSDNALEFGIYLQHMNSKDAKLEYALGQYFLNFNPAIANGGTLKYTIVGSELPTEFQPTNPSVSGDQLRLATNQPQSLNSLPVISDKQPGTLVAKMRLETSAKSFSDANLNLRLRVGPDNPFTKIAANLGGKISDITNKSEVVQNDAISGNEVSSETPKEFALLQNYPNPFNPSTNLKFEIPKSARVELTVYDITGRAIATLVNQQLEPGSHSYRFDGSNFASGIYFFRIKATATEGADQFIQTRKMTLIK